MLDTMDIAGAAAPAAPWITVGVLLAVAALLLAGLGAALVVRRRAVWADRSAPPSDHLDDDLPGFLESPPGTGAAASAVGAHVALATPPAAPAPPERRRVPTAVLAAVAALAVVLLVVAVVVALDSTADSPDRDGRAGRPGGAGPAAPSPELRMTFAGLVLEERAVGVTAAYPELELTADGNGPVARLTLPTWNCLAAEAPDDPAAAGCVPSRTEYAELRPPDVDVDVTATGNGLRVAGTFPTETRPAGRAPEPTRRSYRIEVTATADGDPGSGLPAPATGALTLGNREAESVGGELRLD
jgi:hypothetical protein